MSLGNKDLVTVSAIPIHHHHHRRSMQRSSVNATHHRNHNPNITETSTNHFRQSTTTSDKRQAKHIAGSITTGWASISASGRSGQSPINSHTTNINNNNSSPCSWQSQMDHFLATTISNTKSSSSLLSSSLGTLLSSSARAMSSMIISSSSSSKLPLSHEHKTSVLQLSQQVLLLVVAVLFIGSLGANCVRINSISQPQSYRNGLANSVILDCDFSVDENDDLLVVKWFHNDEPQHVYQWIQSRDLRIYSPKIKPYVDETFVVNDHPTRHRAIRLLNPPPSLSGKYTCSVSSLQNEDINSTYLIVYEPAQSFEIAAVEMDEVDYKQSDDNGQDDGGFNITCTAMGVYPEPEIKLFRIRSINESLEAEEIKSNATSVLSFQSVSDGYYSITLTSHFEQNQTSQTNAEQQSSAEIIDDISPGRERLAYRSSKVSKDKTKPKAVAEHYECRLTIPNSDYFEVKRLAIQDGWRTKFRFNASNSLYKALSQQIFSMTMALMVAMFSVALVADINV